MGGAEEERTDRRAKREHEQERGAAFVVGVLAPAPADEPQADPGARGRAIVETYQAAAEQYGYIVAGSNTSRNGPWAISMASVRASIRRPPLLAQ